MRFASVSAVLRGARDTFLRFPVPVVAGLLAAIVTMTMIEGPEESWQPRLIALAIIGIALTTATATTAERRGYPALMRFLLDGFVVLGLALLFLASRGWSDELTVIRFAPLALGAHVLAAIGPWQGSSEEHGFWQFNRLMLLRWLISAFYAAVLWGGLCVALLALDKLFGVKIPDELYGDLWAVFAFGFHPWFYLAGVPRDFDALETLEEYPIGLKVFTQFVLIPLVTVYLLILTAYLGKVVITRTWPSGWIGYLVSWVSVAGVLALLLVHPIRARADAGWVNVYGRWWFVAILPSLGMLLVAIGKRVGQYGVTEPRYFLLVLAVWMLGVSLYYSLTGAKAIKLIPASLAAVALLTTAGPWSATAVSIRSQHSRFTSILQANGMGSVGAPRPATKPVSIADRRELSAILRYLEDTHGKGVVATTMRVHPDSVARWTADSGLAADRSIAARSLRQLGIEYVGPYDVVNASGPFRVNAAGHRSISVDGFEVARGVSYPALGWIGSAVDSLELVTGADSGVVTAKHGGATVLTLDVRAGVERALRTDSLTANGRRELAHPIVIDGEGGGFRVRLVLEFVSGQGGKDGPVVHGGSGYLLAAGLRRAP